VTAEAGDRHGRHYDHQHDDHKYDDRKYEDRRYEDRRYDDRKYDRGRGGWHAQTGFRVGDFNFSLGYHESGKRGNYYHRPKYYYRTKSHVSYKGYQCDSGCYKRSSNYYHVPACPLVRQHFRTFRFVPPPLPYYYSPYGAEFYYYPPSYYNERWAPYRSRGYRRGW